MPIIRGRRNSERWEYPTPDGGSGPRDFLRRGGRRRRVDEPPEAQLRHDGEARGIERTVELLRSLGAARDETWRGWRLDGHLYADESIASVTYRNTLHAMIRARHDQRQRDWRPTASSYQTGGWIQVPVQTWNTAAWTSAVTANIHWSPMNYEIRTVPSVGAYSAVAYSTQDYVQAVPALRRDELAGGAQPANEAEQQWLDQYRERQERVQREMAEAQEHRRQERVRFNAATDRAWALLRRMAGETEGVRLMERDEDPEGFGHLDVVGSDQLHYRIWFNGYQGNVDVRSKDWETRLVSMCAHMSWRDHEGRSIPEPDHWVSQMLDLLADAPAFLEVANVNFRNHLYHRHIDAQGRYIETEQREQPRDQQGRINRIVAA